MARNYGSSSRSGGGGRNYGNPRSGGSDVPAPTEGGGSGGLWGAISGALGSLKDAGGSFVGKALDVVDTPRAIILSGVKEFSDQLVDWGLEDARTEAHGGASWDDFWNQASDNYSFSKYIQDVDFLGTVDPETQGALARNRYNSGAVLGFAGDVAMDPLSYLTAGATIGSKGVGVSDDIIEAAAKRGLSEEDLPRAVSDVASGGPVKPRHVNRKETEALVSRFVPEFKELRGISDEAMDEVLVNLRKGGPNSLATTPAGRIVADELGIDVGLKWGYGRAQSGIGRRAGADGTAEMVGWSPKLTARISEFTEPAKFSIGSWMRGKPAIRRIPQFFDIYDERALTKGLERDYGRLKDEGLEVAQGHTSPEAFAVKATSLAKNAYNQATGDGIRFAHQTDMSLGRAMRKVEDSFEDPTDLIRYLEKQPTKTALSPEQQQIAEGVRVWMDTTKAKVEELTGLNIGTLDEYFPHHITERYRKWLVDEGHVKHSPSRVDPTQVRQHRKGEKFMGETLKTNSMDEIHEIMKSKGIDFRMFVDDPNAVLLQYKQAMIGRVRAYAFERRLEEAGLAQTEAARDAIAKIQDSETVSARPIGRVNPEVAAAERRSQLATKVAESEMDEADKTWTLLDDGLLDATQGQGRVAASSVAEDASVVEAAASKAGLEERLAKREAELLELVSEENAAWARMAGKSDTLDRLDAEAAQAEDALRVYGDLEAVSPTELANARKAFKESGEHAADLNTQGSKLWVQLQAIDEEVAGLEAARDHLLRDHRRKTETIKAAEERLDVLRAEEGRSKGLLNVLDRNTAQAKEAALDRTITPKAFHRPHGLRSLDAAASENVYVDRAVRKWVADGMPDEVEFPKPLVKTPELEARVRALGAELHDQNVLKFHENSRVALLERQLQVARQKLASTEELNAQVVKIGENIDDLLASRGALQDKLNATAAELDATSKVVTRSREAIERGEALSPEAVARAVAHRDKSLKAASELHDFTATYDAARAARESLERDIVGIRAEMSDLEAKAATSGLGEVAEVDLVAHREWLDKAARVEADGDELHQRIGRLESKAESRELKLPSKPLAASELAASEGKFVTQVLENPETYSKQMYEQAHDALSTLVGTAEGSKSAFVNNELAEAAVKVAEVFQPKPFGDVMRAYMNVMSRWKAWSLVSGGFHIRNFLGGMFNNALAGMDTAMYSRFTRAHTQWKNGGIDNIKDVEMRRLWTEIEGDTVDGRKIRNMLFGRDQDQIRDMGDLARVASAASGGDGVWRRFVASRRASKAKRTQLLDTDVAVDPKVRGTRLDPTDLEENWVLEKNRYGAAWVEGVLRTTLYLDGRLKGMSQNDAIQRMFKHHFNYDELSTLERRYGRMVFPFYTWTRKNMPLQLENMVTQPRLYSRYLQAKNNIEAWSDDPALVPSYYGELMAIRMPGGGDNPSYISPDLPFMNLADVVQPNMLASSVTPLVTMPVQLWAGKQFFSGIPFNEKYAPMSPALLPIGYALAPLKGIPGIPEVQIVDGQPYIKDRDSYKLETAWPLLGRLRRLVPGSDPKYQDRVWASWLSIAFGVRSMKLTDSAIAGEEYRRGLEVREATRSDQQLEDAVAGHQSHSLADYINPSRSEDAN